MAQIHRLENVFAERDIHSLARTPKKSRPRPPPINFEESISDLTLKPCVGVFTVQSEQYNRRASALPSGPISTTPSSKSFKRGNSRASMFSGPSSMVERQDSSKTATVIEIPPEPSLSKSLESLDEEQENNFWKRRDFAVKTQIDAWHQEVLNRRKNLVLKGLWLYLHIFKCSCKNTTTFIIIIY